MRRGDGKGMLSADDDVTGMTAPVIGPPCMHSAAGPRKVERPPLLTSSSESHRMHEEENPCA